MASPTCGRTGLAATTRWGPFRSRSWRSGLWSNSCGNNSERGEVKVRLRTGRPRAAAWLRQGRLDHPNPTADDGPPRSTPVCVSARRVGWDVAIQTRQLDHQLLEAAVVFVFAELRLLLEQRRDRSFDP